MIKDLQQRSLPRITAADLKDPNQTALNQIINRLGEQVASSQGALGPFKIHSEFNAPDGRLNRASAPTDDNQIVTLKDLKNITAAATSQTIQTLQAAAVISYIPPAAAITDIGENINGLIATAVAASKEAVFIELLAGNKYTYHTTIHIPSTIYVDIDFKGCELTYAGTTTGIQIDPAPQSGDPFITGKMANIELLGNATASVVGIHHESRIGMVYEDIRVWNFTGTGAIGLWFENKTEAAGLPNFCEQNTIRKADFGNNTTAIKASRTTGSNSFMYNVFEDVHFDVQNGQTGLAFVGTGATQSLFINGGFYNLKFNCHSPTVACKCISLTAGPDWERATVVINGEQTSGAVVSTGLYVDAASIFYNFGFFEIDGTTNTLAGVGVLQPRGFPNSELPINTYSLDCTGLARFQKDMRLGIPTYGLHLNNASAQSDISFSILIPAGSVSATKTFTRAYNSTPNCAIALNTPITKHLVTTMNIVMSSPLPVTVSGTVDTFTADINDPPVMTAFTPTFSGTGSATGTIYGTITVDVPDYPTLDVTNTQCTANIQTAQGGDVTIFVVCIGNPD